MANSRLFLSLPPEDVKKLDILREELGMNRSQFIRYLLSGQRKLIPSSIKQKDLVYQLSQIDLHLRDIALKDVMRPEDVLYIHEIIKEIKKDFVKV